MKNQEQLKDKYPDIEIGNLEKLTLYTELLFDGYNLKWIENGNNSTYTAFSGDPQERYKESKKDLGPTPQGEYTVSSKDIQDMDGDAWGNYRVKLHPIKTTVNRMVNCFSLVRTDMYIHGGKFKGTLGCIELNKDHEEEEFFNKLKSNGGKLKLIVKYLGDRKEKYEESKCPYS